MKFLLIVVLFEEMFIPHSSLQSSWDMIGTRLYLINVEIFLISPNLTQNSGFAFGSVTPHVPFSIYHSDFYVMILMGERKREFQLQIFLTRSVEEKVEARSEEAEQRLKK